MGLSQSLPTSPAFLLDIETAKWKDKPEKHWYIKESPSTHNRQSNPTGKKMIAAKIPSSPKDSSTSCSPAAHFAYTTQIMDMVRF